MLTRSSVIRRLGPIAAAGVVATVLMSCVDSGPVGSEATCDSSAIQTPIGQAPLYQGALYDTHAHLDESGFAAQLGCRMLAHEVERAVLFAYMNPDGATDSEKNLKANIEGFPGRFVPFFHVDPKSPADVSPARLDRVVQASPSLFRGIGEFGLYRQPWQGSDLADSPWPAVFEWAAANDMWLMLHVRPDLFDQLDQMLTANPDVKVLLHGFDFPDRVPELLLEHPNLHFTLDTSVLLLDDRGQFPQPIMFPNQGGAQFFKDDVDARWQEMLDASVARWAPTVAAAPDRVFWGTDVAMDWHADPEIYARLIAFSRAFIQRLPAEHRDGVAHGNARRLIGAS